MRGFEFVDQLHEEFAKLGTAGLPLRFIADGGKRFVALDIVTENHETRVLLLEEGK